MHHGNEILFITSIDWQNQRQKIRFSLNQGALDLPKGMSLDWCEPTCRALSLSGLTHSGAIDSMLPLTAGAAKLGIKSLVTVPILQGDIPIGTLCCASVENTELDAKQLECMQLIADAVHQTSIAKESQRKSGPQTPSVMPLMHALLPSAMRRRPYTWNNLPIRTR